jgi:translation initiation factor 1
MTKPVYSTATGPYKEAPKKKDDGYRKAAGPTKMRLETKGRGGKAVTVLFNLPFEEDEARQLMKDLQAAAGCGATMKNGQIELQGDRRDKVDAHFTRQGWKLVRAGG